MERNLKQKRKRGEKQKKNQKRKEENLRKTKENMGEFLLYLLWQLLVDVVIIITRMMRKNRRMRR